MSGENGQSGRKTEARERRLDFAFVYRELLYCYGRMIGPRGIAVWSYIKLHQYGGDVWKELTGYAWASQSRIGADLGLDRRVIHRTLKDLQEAGLVSAVRASEMFDAEEMERLRQKGREAGETLHLQPAGILLIAHDPLTREEFIRWNEGKECSTCSHASSCRAYQEYVKEKEIAFCKGRTFFVPPSEQGSTKNVRPSEQGGTFFVHKPSMEMEREMERKQQQGDEDAVSVMSSSHQCTAPQDGSSGTLRSGTLEVLEHFLDRVAELWPNASAGKGQPLSRVVRKRYEGLRALLAGEVSPAAVSQAPAEVVEELLILAQTVKGQGSVEPASAVDRALEAAGRSPVLRLSYTWFAVPGAKSLRWHLRRNLREGGRLPDGGGYRDARRLFILLNCFDVGPPLLDRFLELCREAGVGVVLDILQEALRAGRACVSLSFLQEAVRRRRETAARPPGDMPAGEFDLPEDAGDAAEPGPGPPAGQSRLPHGGSGVPPPDGLVRMWLSDYGITEPALSELQSADYALVRAWMLYLEAQKRLAPEVRQAILVSRLRDGSDPPGKWLRLARMLPRLDPVEEFMLEEEYHRRRRNGRWSEDILELVGEEAAERWLEFRRRMEEIQT